MVRRATERQDRPGLGPEVIGPAGAWRALGRIAGGLPHDNGRHPAAVRLGRADPRPCARTGRRCAGGWASHRAAGDALARAHRAATAGGSARVPGAGGGAGVRIDDAREATGNLPGHRTTATAATVLHPAADLSPGAIVRL